MSTSSPILALAGVSKSFGPVVALKDASFDVLPGEIHAIVGENGAGKSTLIAIAAGVLPANAGTITLEGKVIDAPSPTLMRALGLSVAYQSPALAPDLTVLENLQLAAPMVRLKRVA